MPELIQSVSGTDAAREWKVVAGTAECGIPVVARISRNTIQTDNIRYVIRRIVGRAEKLVLEEAVPAEPDFIYLLGEKTCVSLRLAF